MTVTSLEAENFRNIEKLEIRPCENVNVIYGENAQGKTNLIESIWLFTGCRSFRGTKEKELISFGKENARLSIDYDAYGREKDALILLGEKKKMSVCGVLLPSASKGMGEFLAVVFSPAHLSLVKQGPSERRKFLDVAISQLKPNYAALLSEYNRTVIQRNCILKDYLYHPELDALLDIWEEKAAQYAARIAVYRQRYVERLKEETEEIYYGLSSGREKIEIKYVQPFEELVTDKKQFMSMLKKSRTDDAKTGSSSVGIHRDDIEININGISARHFGSQGQQRSCALAMKLGEAGVIKKITGEQPVALLDDVMSELDYSRQDYVLNKIKDWQVFITCCDKNAVLNLKKGKCFKMENGYAKEE